MHCTARQSSPYFKSDQRMESPRPGVWVVNTWLILPWANPVMLKRQMVAPMWWLGYHLIFGAMLFLAPLLVGVFGRRDERCEVRSAV